MSRSEISAYILVAAAIFAALSLEPSLAFAYDAAADFSATNNPNGAWTYFWSASLTPSSSTLHVYPQHGNNSGIDYWDDPNNISLGVPEVSHNGTPNQIQVSTVQWQPGQLAFHPGQNGEYSFVRWTSPVAQTFTVAASFVGIDNGSGTTTDVHVLHNGVSLFSGNINGFGNTATFPATQVAVLAGDTIDFAVGFGSDGNYFNDSTGLAATIVAPAICSLTNPASISGSTGAQGVLDPANIDSSQGLVWPAGAVSAGISMDTGQVVFQDSSQNTLSTVPLLGATGAPFPNGVLNFISVHLPAGIGVNFSTLLTALQPPVIILSCQDVVLDANSTLTVGATSSKGPVPAGFLGASGSTVPSINAAGFGPRSGALPAAGSLYPPIGGGGGSGAGSLTGGGGGPAFLIAAAQRITVNGLIASGGLAAATGSSLAQGGGGGTVRLAGLLVEGMGTINTSGGSDSDGVVRSPAGPVEVQAFLQDLFTGTTSTTPIRGNLPVQPIPANLPTISITNVSSTNPVFNQTSFPNTGSLTTPDVTLPVPSATQVTVNIWIPSTLVPDGTIMAVRAVGTDGSAFTTNATISGGDAFPNLTLNAGATYQIVVTPGTAFSLARPNLHAVESADARKRTGASIQTAGITPKSSGPQGLKTSSLETSVTERLVAEEWMKAFGVNPDLSGNGSADGSGGKLLGALR